jgi:hypothetical protein
MRRAALRSQRLRILDVGGTAKYWTALADDIACLDCEVLVVNFDVDELNHEELGRLRDRISFAVGNATSLPYGDGSFDLVHSNSVIEHVGTWRDTEAAAKEIRRLAPSYYVQVPYFWFPYEVHYRALFVHWLPEQWQARIFMQFDMGDAPTRTLSGAMRKVQHTRLLDRLQFHELFPDAAIEHERFLGLTKSLIAIKAAL